MKNRRYFLKKSGLAFTGLAFYNSISAKSYRNILGSNDRINIAFQGLGRRIPGLLNGAVSQKNIEVKFESKLIFLVVPEVAKALFSKGTLNI